MPFTYHVTAVFASPVTLAANCNVPKLATVPVDGESDTEIALGPGRIVTCAAAA